MIVVNSTDFKRNFKKYTAVASQEDLIVKTTNGSFKFIPVKEKKKRKTSLEKTYDLYGKEFVDKILKAKALGTKDRVELDMSKIDEFLGL